MLLCDVRVIYKNPKYKVIQHNGEYLLVDLVSIWLVYFLPFINWFIPKRYAIISEEEFENLNVIKPNKNNVFWSIIGSSILFGVTLRKYIHVFDVQLDKLVVMILCALAFICVIVFYFNLNRKLKLKVFDTNIEKNKRVILIPTFKLGCFLVFWIYFCWKFFDIYTNCPYDNRTSKYNNIYLLDYDDNAFLFVKYGFDR
ncbi:conserved hypothetical protein [Staphylococcus aureus subsp. aureus H19]|nr:conserved hypothetical protein [Staphylococcus aureus subsp. aureus H19]